MRRSAVLGLAMLATLAAAPDTRAQLGVEAVANYAGLDRQKILEQGARREGSLLLYTHRPVRPREITPCVRSAILSAARR